MSRVVTTMLPKALRTARYAVLGAALAILAGRLIVLVTGMTCHCFINDPLVALQSGLIGGAFFSFIYRPDLFRQSGDLDEEGSSASMKGFEKNEA